MEAIITMFSLFVFLIVFLIAIYVLNVIPNRLNSIKKQNEQIYKILE